MSYQFLPNHYYRMPTHFGPSLGPRQGVAGSQYACIDTPKFKGVSATFEADSRALEKLLPPQFVLQPQSEITFSFEYLTDIEWLAGRGYNTFGVSIPAIYRGKEDTVQGSLLLVLWENRADPIITGREELGFAKLYSELPDVQVQDETVTCCASWDGFEFSSLSLSELRTVSVETLSDSTPSDGTLHYKYIPKTGSPGEADAAYATLTPAGEPNFTLTKIAVADKAQLKIHSATWEQLPTLVHIVNPLAELVLGPCKSAMMVEGFGGKDLSDQRILR